MQIPVTAAAAAPAVFQAANQCERQPILLLLPAHLHSCILQNTAAAAAAAPAAAAAAAVVPQAANRVERALMSLLMPAHLRCCNCINKMPLPPLLLLYCQAASKCKRSMMALLLHGA
jgi:hypothetical protein